MKVTKLITTLELLHNQLEALVSAGKISAEESLKAFEVILKEIMTHDNLELN